MKARNEIEDTCSCSSCVYKSESDNPLKRFLGKSSEVDKLYFGKYIPLRESKLLEKLVRTRAEYDDIRAQLVSDSTLSSSRKPHLVLKKQQPKTNINSSVNIAVQEFVDLVDQGSDLKSSMVDECCGCCSCLSKVNRHVQSYPNDVRGKYGYIRNNFNEIEKDVARKRGVRFRPKYIQSDPCICTSKLRHLIEKTSKNLHAKLKQDNSLPVLPNKDELSQTLKRNRIDKLSRSLYKKKKELSLYNEDILIEGTRKLNESKNKFKQSGREYFKYKDTVGDISETQYEDIKLQKRKHDINICPCSKGQLVLKLRKDSIRKFKDDLAKKRILKDWECKPECIESICLPKVCIEKIKMREGRVKKTPYQKVINHDHKKQRVKYDIQTTTTLPEKSDLLNVDIQISPKTSSNQKRHFKKKMKRETKKNLSRTCLCDDSLQSGNLIKSTSTGFPPNDQINQMKIVKPSKDFGKSIKLIPMQKSEEIKRTQYEYSHRPHIVQENNASNKYTQRKQKIASKRSRSSQFKMEHSFKDTQFGGHMLKRCFCTLKFKPKGHKKKSFEKQIFTPHISDSRPNIKEIKMLSCLNDPSLCVNNACDYKECDSILQNTINKNTRTPVNFSDQSKRLKYKYKKSPRKTSKHIGTKGTQRKSTSSFTTYLPAKSRTVQLKSIYKDNLRPGLYEPQLLNEEKIDDRQVDKIGSSFNLNIEFYKNTPTTDVISSFDSKTINSSPKRRRRKSMKYIQTQIDNKEQNTLKKSLKLHSKRNGRKQASNLFKKINHPDMKVQMVNKGTKINKNRVRLLEPYEREYNECIPGECDPYVSLERLKKRFKHTSVAAELPDTVSISSATDNNKSRHIQVQSRPSFKRQKSFVKSNLISKVAGSTTPQQSNYFPEMSRSKSVRLSSTFSFAIEFHKEKNPIKISQYEKKSYGIDFSKKGKNKDIKPIKLIDTDNHLKFNKHHKSSLVNTVLKRCFCTLNLAKRGHNTYDNKKKSSEKNLSISPKSYTVNRIIVRDIRLLSYKKIQAQNNCFLNSLPDTLNTKCSSDNSISDQSKDLCDIKTDIKSKIYTMDRKSFRFGLCNGQIKKYYVNHNSYPELATYVCMKDKFTTTENDILKSSNYIERYNFFANKAKSTLELIQSNSLNICASNLCTNKTLTGISSCWRNYYAMNAHTIYNRNNKQNGKKMLKSQDTVGEISEIQKEKVEHQMHKYKRDDNICPCSKEQLVLKLRKDSIRKFKDDIAKKRILLDWDCKPELIESICLPKECVKKMKLREGRVKKSSDQEDIKQDHRKERIKYNTHNPFTIPEKEYILNGDTKLTHRRRSKQKSHFQKKINAKSNKNKILRKCLCDQYAKHRNDLNNKYTEEEDEKMASKNSQFKMDHSFIDTQFGGHMLKRCFCTLKFKPKGNKKKSFEKIFFTPHISDFRPNIKEIKTLSCLNNPSLCVNNECDRKECNRIFKRLLNKNAHHFNSECSQSNYKTNARNNFFLKHIGIKGIQRKSISGFTTSLPSKSRNIKSKSIYEDHLQGDIYQPKYFREEKLNHRQGVTIGSNFNLEFYGNTTKKDITSSFKSSSIKGRRRKSMKYIPAQINNQEMKVKMANKGTKISRKHVRLLEPYKREHNGECDPYVCLEMFKKSFKHTSAATELPDTVSVSSATDNNKLRHIQVQSRLSFKRQNSFAKPNLITGRIEPLQSNFLSDTSRKKSVRLSSTFSFSIEFHKEKNPLVKTKMSQYNKINKHKETEQNQFIDTDAQLKDKKYHNNSLISTVLRRCFCTLNLAKHGHIPYNNNLIFPYEKHLKNSQKVYTVNRVILSDIRLFSCYKMQTTKNSLLNHLPNNIHNKSSCALICNQSKDLCDFETDVENLMYAIGRKSYKNFSCKDKRKSDPVKKYSYPESTTCVYTNDKITTTRKDFFKPSSYIPPYSFSASETKNCNIYVSDFLINKTVTGISQCFKSYFTMNLQTIYRRDNNHFKQSGRNMLRAQDMVRDISETQNEDFEDKKHIFKHDISVCPCSKEQLVLKLRKDSIKKFKDDVANRRRIKDLECKSECIESISMPEDCIKKIKMRESRVKRMPTQRDGKIVHRKPKMKFDLQKKRNNNYVKNLEDGFEHNKHIFKHQISACPCSKEQLVLKLRKDSIKKFKDDVAKKRINKDLECKSECIESISMPEDCIKKIKMRESRVKRMPTQRDRKIVHRKPKMKFELQKKRYNKFVKNLESYDSGEPGECNPYDCQKLLLERLKSKLTKGLGSKLESRYISTHNVMAPTLVSNKTRSQMEEIIIEPKPPQKYHNHNTPHISRSQNTHKPNCLKNAIYNLAPSECLPNICIPGHCDPYNCLEIMKKINFYEMNDKGTSTKNKNKAVFTCTNGVLNKKSFATNRSYKNMSKEPKPTSFFRPNEGLTSKSKQCVRFGSNISFKVEFYKDVSDDNNINYIKPNIKSKMPVVFHKSNQKSAYQQHVQLQKELPSTTSVGSITPSFLKRCFCTAKLLRTNEPFINEQPKNFLKKCFCLLKFTKKNKSETVSPNTQEILTADKTINVSQSFIQVEPILEAGECLPSICTPGECDPILCYDIMKKYNQKKYSRFTATNLVKKKSTAIYTNLTRLKTAGTQSHKMRKHRNLEYYTPDTHSDKQCLRIGSNFSFNIEFSKQTYPKTHGIVSEKLYDSQYKKSKTNARNVKQIGTNFRPIAIDRQTQKQNMKKDRSVNTKSFLKRCFCLLKIRNDQKNAVKEKSILNKMKTIGVMTAEKNKLYSGILQLNDFQNFNHEMLPYECEPYTWTPGECNPLECLEKIKIRNILRANTGTLTDNYIYNSIGNLTNNGGFKSKHRKLQTAKFKQEGLETPVKFKTKYVKKQTSNRQVVCISSNFDFNIEFYKDKTCDELEKNCDSHKSMDISKNYPTIDKKCQRLTSHRHTKTNPTISKTKSVISHVTPMLKRCFCTYDLQNYIKNSNIVKSLETKIGSTQINEPIMKLQMKGKTMTDTKSNQTHKKYFPKKNLQTYECEPNICVPGQCDRYKCYELMQKRLRKDCGVATVVNWKDFSSNTAPCNKCKSKKLQSKSQIIGSYKPTKITCPKQLNNFKTRRNRNVVRIRSNFGFNIEIYKRTPKESDYVNNSRGNRTSVKNKINVLKNQYLDEATQSLHVVKKSQSSLAKEKWQRCFCTKNLFKDRLQYVTNSAFIENNKVIKVLTANKNNCGVTGKRDYRINQIPFPFNSQVDCRKEINKKEPKIKYHPRVNHATKNSKSKKRFNVFHIFSKLSYKNMMGSNLSFDLELYKRNKRNPAKINKLKSRYRQGNITSNQEICTRKNQSNTRNIVGLKIVESKNIQAQGDVKVCKECIALKRCCSTINFKQNLKANTNKYRNSLSPKLYQQTFDVRRVNLKYSLNHNAGDRKLFLVSKSNTRICNRKEETTNTKKSCNMTQHLPYKKRNLFEKNNIKLTNVDGKFSKHTLIKKECFHNVLKRLSKKVKLLSLFKLNRMKIMSRPNKDVPNTNLPNNLMLYACNKRYSRNNQTNYGQRLLRSTRKNVKCIGSDSRIKSNCHFIEQTDKMVQYKL